MLSNWLIDSNRRDEINRLNLRIKAKNDEGALMTCKKNGIFVTTVELIRCLNSSTSSTSTNGTHMELTRLAHLSNKELNIRVIQVFLEMIVY